MYFVTIEKNKKGDKKTSYLNLIVGWGGGWIVESTPINIREYFKHGLQHGFEIF